VSAVFSAAASGQALPRAMPSRVPVQSCVPIPWRMPIPWRVPAPGSREPGREYLFNSGGPSSRRRTERIHSTLLGDDGGAVRCPPVRSVGIDFGDGQPVAYARFWLSVAGFGDEQEAREALSLPPAPCICQIDPNLRPPAADALSAGEGLRLALLLGLCTPFLYDPRRPVLWTEASLTRRLVLYDGGGFYA
jgi:hypothetical protein